MISLCHKARRLAPLLVALLVVWLSGCSIGQNPDKTLTIATVFPQTGANAAVGRSMQDAVDLAGQQNATLPKGYKLTVAHVDEAAGSLNSDMTRLIGNHHVMGIVGPMGSDSAISFLQMVDQNGIATISPTTTLTGLTQASAAATEGLTFTDLHPQGSPVAFFRLASTDDAIGKEAADVAVGPTQSNGLGAQSVFIVDDGSASGKAVAAAFAHELKAKQGGVAGQKSLVTGPQDNTQSIVTAIIDADPGIVFFAGDTAAGAELRATLSLTGASQLVMLATGPLANNPNWGAAVGITPAAANTTAILPHADLSTLSGAKGFLSAFQAAYPNETALPQSALAYDAAMDEITAISAVLKTGKQVTRAAVLGLVASTKYPGITGSIAFAADGDNTSPLGFSLYNCDAKGVWHYQVALQSS